MRILHITKKYPNALGGDAIVVQNLEEQQKKNGHEVFILTTNCDDIINKKDLIKFGLKDTPANLDNITIKRFISLINLFFKSFSLIKELHPDIVHSHSVDMGYIMSFACRKYNTPLIETYHAGSFNDKKYPLTKRLLDKFLFKISKFNKIIVLGKNLLKDFKREKINGAIYIPNGVNQTNILHRKNKSKKIRFIFVGRLEDQKGLEYLIDAVNEVVKLNKNFEILLIGEGSKKEELRKKINNLKLKNYFNFLGSKSNKEVIRSYSTSDIFILPSLWEGLPLTLLEALASGLPVITTDVGGISDICTDNENALIIPPKNTREIKDAMIRLINNPRLRKQLGENGRQLVKNKYSWEKINSQIEDVYRSIFTK